MVNQRHTVPAGTVLELYPSGAPWTLSLSPGSGGTAQAHLCAFMSIADASRVWHPLFDAPVSAASLASFPGPVACVRITATTANAVAELAW